MSLPAYAGESEVESYRQGQNTDQYREFIAGENKYFKSEYLFEDILEKYAFESNPRPRCHIPSPLVGSDEQSVAQCMSSRPPNLLIPHEFALQMYLSRPGRENPYVPMTFDYITLEDEYILVMEHLDEKWSTLSKYVEKKGQLDIEEARNIIKEIVNGMISLKNHGVVHEDLNGWEGGKSVPLKSSDPPSTASEYKAETDELQITGHRIQSGLLPAIQKSRLRLLGRSTRSGCGECIYLAQWWSLKWRSRSGPAVVGRGTVEHAIYGYEA
ncbi:hypothetical protein BASA83_002076 [Batrachochytrium salamandrivorans]|nr:hypothetical protein BASA83_002076 [Batrachochytrium salamandrivorans]